MQSARNESKLIGLLHWRNVSLTLDQDFDLRAACDDWSDGGGTRVGFSNIFWQGSSISQANLSLETNEGIIR